MKILHIIGTDDYDASEFEEEYSGQHVDKLIKQLEKDPTLVCKSENGWEGKTFYDYKIVDVPDIVISKEFRNFIKNDVIDYDAGKHANFYLQTDII